MHRGVTMTMSDLREHCWIPSLRKITKSIIKKCHHCKRYRAMPYPSPKPGPLPKERTQECHPFEVIEDYAGPIYYVKNKAISKSCILFSCSVSRAINLELVRNLTTQFIKSIKRLIARRGSPKIIYSDNAKTFQAGAKWLIKINKDEKFHNFLSNENITWKFNLSKAPWWGGQFERLIDLTKQTLYRTIGKALLKWEELEVLLDIEFNLNNRPLTYIEDVIAHQPLTPNSILLGRDLVLPPDQEVTSENEGEKFRKRQKYVQKCKQAASKRFRHKYLVALRERHSLNHKSKDANIQIGDVVIIRESKNRGNWKLAIVEKLHRGKAKVVRVVGLRTAKNYLERPIQLLYSMELHCNTIRKTS